MSLQLDVSEHRLQNLETAHLNSNRHLLLVETMLTEIEGKVTALHNDVVELFMLASKFNKKS